MTRIQKLVLGIIVGTLVFGALIVMVLIRQLGFRVTGHEPDRVSSLSQVIVVSFNKTIDTKQRGTITVTPKLGGSSKIDGSTLYFYPLSPYTNGQTYTVSVQGYQSTSGQIMKPLIFSFRADGRVTTPNTKAQQQAQVIGTDALDGNPLLSKLPYDGFTFKITATVSGDVGTRDTWKDFKNNYVVKIQTFAYNQPGKSDQYKSDTLRFRQQALGWIRQQGVDPSKDIQTSYSPSDQELGITNQ